ncbi:MAG: hypothetical protein WBG42_16940 [Cryomorphaceae bacterium]
MISSFLHFSGKTHQILILLLMVTTSFLFPAGSQAQEAEKTNRPKHRITAMMANSHIPAADNIEGQNSVFIAPTWALNYDYWLSEKFAIGVHSDLVIQKFEIKNREDGLELERSFPLAVCAVGIYRPFENWSLIFGGGQEFEKTENFAMLCLGVEYGIELPKEWELSFNLIYDNKIDAYDTWMFGVGFSKLFEL